MQKIVPFLWYEDKAEEAVNLYISLFKNSEITNIKRYGPDAPFPEGFPFVIEFTLDGQEYIAMNAGPHTEFTDAVSMMVYCDDQEEVDRLWEALLADGGQEQACGWVTDKFGLRWQITPTVLMEMMKDPDTEKADRATQAMLKMIKLDIAELQRAFDGN